jgi:hypothetical protein
MMVCLTYLDYTCLYQENLKYTALYKSILTVKDTYEESTNETATVHSVAYDNKATASDPDSLRHLCNLRHSSRCNITMRTPCYTDSHAMYYLQSAVSAQLSHKLYHAQTTNSWQRQHTKHVALPFLTSVQSTSHASCMPTVTKLWHPIDRTMDRLRSLPGHFGEKSLAPAKDQISECPANVLITILNELPCLPPLRKTPGKCKILASTKVPCTK